MPRTERRIHRRAAPAESDPALMSDAELPITELKPHLSGTLWRLSGADTVWTDALIAYVRHVETVLRGRANQIIGRSLASAPEKTTVLHIPAYVCDQRREEPRDDETLLRRLDEG